MGWVGRRRPEVKRKRGRVGKGGVNHAAVSDATEKRAQKLWPLPTTLHTVVLAAYIAFLFSDYAAALDIFLQL